MEDIHQKTSMPVIILILVVISLIDTVHSNECVDVSNPQTRSFPMLISLQANKDSFKAGSPNFRGNYITIQEDLSNLGRNSFICYTSNYITKMFLSGRQISQIQEGAFISLDCVMVLDLHENLIRNIARETFEGLTILHELNLGHNKLDEVSEHAFTLLPRLKVLNLTRNSIRVLHRYSFYNLSSLEQLDLNYNYLHSISPDILRFFGELLNLQLGSNRLDRVEFEKWNLPKLRTLNLTNNVLESFDTSYELKFGVTLKELYLDQNYLTQINPYGLKTHLRNLALIDINNNPWSCPYLAPLVTTLNETRVSFTGFSTDGDLNIAGIACNRSMDLYIQNKAVDVAEKTEAPQHTSPSTTDVSAELAMDKILLSNMQIVESLKTLYTVIMLLSVVIVIFILIEILIRCNVVNYITRLKGRVRGDSNGSVNITSDNIEEVCLLRERQ